MNEDTRKLLKKAERALRTAKSLLRGEDMEVVVSRAYYAMFYMAEALLNEKGLSYRKHSGVHSAFGKHFVKSGEFDQKYHQRLIQSFNKRLSGDYAFDAEISLDNAEQMTVWAEEFLEAAKHYLSK